MRKIIIGLVFTIGFALSTADISSGQQLSPAFFDNIRAKIDAATKYWVDDIKKLTSIDVEIANKERDLFKDEFIKKVAVFVDNKDRVVQLGKLRLTKEAIDQIRSRGVFKALKMEEESFWYDLGLRNAIFLTAETTRNIYYALLLAQIGTTSANPKITLLIEKYLQFLDCQNPPYSKWYCH